MTSVVITGRRMNISERFICGRSHSAGPRRSGGCGLNARGRRGRGVDICGAGVRLSFRQRRFHRHLRARHEPEVTLCHDHLAEGEPALDDDLVAECLACLDHPVLDGHVGLDHVGVFPGLAVLDRRYGSDERALHGREHQRDVDVLSRPEPLVLVVKGALERYGARVARDGVVDECERAVLGAVLPSGQGRHHVKRAQVGVFLDAREVLLRQREDDRDGLDLVYPYDGRVVRLDGVAAVDEERAGPSVDGRGDAAVA